ncbi:MAG TPA: CAP domain-containing protein [Longimicrobium sp.]|jgi:uncharacterized protein YkwD
MKVLRSLSVGALCSIALAGCTAGAYRVEDAAPRATLAATRDVLGCAADAATLRAGFAANPQEQELASILETAPGQARHGMRFNPTLARVARARAADMARRGYFGHTDPDGLGANTHVTRAGFRLPVLYDARPSGNNIESLGGGYASPRAAWGAWMGSTGHRTHLLGLGDFYRAQTDYGVGYVHAPGSRYGHYWVVLIAAGACA